MQNNIILQQFEKVIISIFLNLKIEFTNNIGLKRKKFNLLMIIFITVVKMYMT